LTAWISRGLTKHKVDGETKEVEAKTNASKPSESAPSIKEQLERIRSQNQRIIDDELKSSLVAVLDDEEEVISNSNIGVEAQLRVLCRKLTQLKNGRF